MLKARQPTPRKRKSWTCSKTDHAQESRDSMALTRKMQSRAKLLAGIFRELLPKLALAFGVLPKCAIKPIVITPALRCQPDFVQRFLQVHYQLTAVGKGDGDHAADPLVVYVYIGLFVEQVAGFFQLLQQALGLVHEFVIGHLRWFLCGELLGVGAAITISS
jgi:hypothetical protein